MRSKLKNLQDLDRNLSIPDSESNTFTDAWSPKEIERMNTQRKLCGSLFQDMNFIELSFLEVLDFTWVHWQLLSATTTQRRGRAALRLWYHESHRRRQGKALLGAWRVVVSLGKSLVFCNVINLESPH